MRGSVGIGDADELKVAVDGGLEELFRQEYEPMHRLAFTMLGSDSGAEVVVQDAFVEIARRWDAIDNPGGYLRASVVNGARKHRNRRRTAAELTDDVSPVVTSPSEDLLDLVERLPERERMAVVLRYYGGWNSGEIGTALECPAGTVRSLLHRSMSTLREMLDDA